MKKRWLSLCGIYFLGLATVPGLMLAQRWRQDSYSPRPKFTEAVFVDSEVEKAAPRDEAAPFEEAVLAENSEPALVDSEFGSAESAGSTPRGLPTKQRPLTLDFDDAIAADLKPPQRTTNLHDEFESPRQAVTLVIPKRSPTAASSPQADIPDGIDSLAEPNPSDEQKVKLTSLRDKLTELMKAKAELINEQTLSQEVSALEKQISDLHAAQKLLSAQEILKALVEEFPQSPAAVRAKRMLEAAGMKGAAWRIEPLRPVPEPAEALPTYR